MLLRCTLPCRALCVACCTPNGARRHVARCAMRVAPSPGCVFPVACRTLHVAYAGANKAYLVATTVAAIPAEAAATGLERVVLHLPGTHAILHATDSMQRTACNGQHAILHAACNVACTRHHAPDTMHQTACCRQLVACIPADAAKIADNRVWEWYRQRIEGHR